MSKCKFINCIYDNTVDLVEFINCHFINCVFGEGLGSELTEFFTPLGFTTFEDCILKCNINALNEMEGLMFKHCQVSSINGS